MSEKPHKRLIVWQRAMDLIEKVYRLTEQFPDEERFGLTVQMRRSSVSIATNIAEGAARQTSKESLQFFFIARGSLSELDTQIEICSRLRLITKPQQTTALDDLNEVGRLLHGLLIYKKKATHSPLTTHSLTHSLT